jgi:glucose-6-phosphate isomerase
MLQIDYAGCMADRLGDAGLTSDDLARGAGTLAPLLADLDRTRGTGWERWRLLGEDPMRSEHLDAVRRTVAEVGPGCRNLVVLGIGGSALGNIALHSALRPSTWNLMADEPRGGPRLFVLDNVDPGRVGDMLELLADDDPGFDQTVINVISKSGETAETAAQFLAFRDRLRGVLGNAHASRVVAVTDPARGTMRAICDEAGYRTLPVPEGVGGRFSALSPVGLFSAAMCGIDVEALLDGAAAMETRCRSTELTGNPAALLAWLLTEFGRRGRPIHVLMPYADALHDLADWYRQLWAESLGKRRNLRGEEVLAGFTPVRALGATDQHSQIQLYREGPHDKVIGLVAVEDLGPEVRLPEDVPEAPLAYLAGASLGGLLDAERRATEFALLESGRPTYTIRLPRVDARHVGAFMMLWQVATAVAGRILGVDAFDQPAVETGKQATFGLMGREGYGEWRHRVESALDDHEHVV